MRMSWRTKRLKHSGSAANNKTTTPMAMPKYRRLRDARFLFDGLDGRGMRVRDDLALLNCDFLPFNAALSLGMATPYFSS